jgi:hypothetical protein
MGEGFVMSDMPKEIWAGDSQGYNMWREGDGVVVLDSETKYIRADLFEKYEHALKDIISSGDGTISRKIAVQALKGQDDE